MRRVAVLAALLAFGVGAAACGDGEGGGPVPDGALEPEVTVLAAASLTDAFTGIAAAFEGDHPGTRVRLNFGSSSSLREQVLQGAPADVVASADEPNMDALLAAGAVVEPAAFARNRLVIAVPADDPGSVDSLADFADEGLLLGLCAPEVPCGRLARQALRSAGVVPAVDTEAPDVRALLTQLESGDLDAGIVYVTDVVAAGDDERRVDIPAEQNVTTTYPIALVTDGPSPVAAAAFVAFVRSADGAAELRRHGFLPT